MIRTAHSRRERVILRALSALSAVLLPSPRALAQVGFAVHAEGAAAHALGDPSGQPGWGATALMAPEVRIGRKIGVELPLGVVGLTEGARMDPAYARASAGLAFMALPGMRLRPLAGAAPGWGDGLWIAAGGGVADTAGLACPSIDARLGFDFRLGRAALGPAIGYVQIVDVSSAPIHRDARVGLLGVHAHFEVVRRASTPPPAAEEPAPPLRDDPDEDGVAVTVDTCPDAAAPAADGSCRPAPPSPVQDVFTLHERVLFDRDSATISPADLPRVQAVADALRRHPGYGIRISGYTDDLGTEPHNLHLSRARAEAVRAAIAGQGVDAGRLTVRFYGSSRPVRQAHTLDALRQNRRVELQAWRPGDAAGDGSTTARKEALR